ncbi:MAG: phage tail protein, partial [Marinobacter sp.]|nr:phage tail protein [Marinobacter sp.]
MLAADVVINEFMAANQRTIEDGYGASSDWIELLNQGDAAADLSQMFLTDDPDNLTKWG